jgi:hypothetical protein
MAEVPILSGVFTDGAADIRVAYPVNMVPVPMDSGISKGYLRPSDGIIQTGTGPGSSRGGVNWNGVCYRVMGSTLVSVSSTGAVTAIGDVGTGGQCTFDYSPQVTAPASPTYPGYLAISSGGALYVLTSAGVLTKVTDVDLGTCLDIIWVDGYFISTDGNYLVQSALHDPFTWTTTGYGASDVDPDPIKSVNKIRNEVAAVNRYSIEFFRNIGGTFNFTFERINGAQINKGSIGTYMTVVFQDFLAFVGSGRNESPGVFLGTHSQAQKISTTEVDTILLQYTESALSGCTMEVRNDRGQKHIWINLPDRTLVYDLDASQAFGAPVWFVLTSGLSGFSRYVAKDLVWCYDKWLVANPVSFQIGYLTDSTSQQWGATARWEFSTQILYNAGMGAIVHQLELVCLTGRAPSVYTSGTTEGPAERTITSSYSVDGRVWSQPKAIKIGSRGNGNKRIIWYNQGHLRNFRIQRFQGDTLSYISVARLEAQLERLAV